MSWTPPGTLDGPTVLEGDAVTGTDGTSIAVWDATIWQRDPAGRWRIAVDPAKFETDVAFLVREA